MREFTLPVRDCFVRGLRRDHRSVEGLGSFVQSLNMLPSDVGTIPFEPLPAAFEQELSYWPFPQVFQGSESYLIADSHSFQEVVAGETKGIFPLSLEDLNQRAVVPVWGAWHFIDLSPGFILLNGKAIVYRGPQYSQAVCTTKYRVQTGCSFKGRVLYAGFDKNFFWSDDWFGFWKEMAGERYDESEFDKLLSREHNFVWWSSVGGGDVFLPFQPDFNKERMLESLQRNESGFMPLPFQGQILCLKDIGSAVVAYGEQGIAALLPVSSPESTFGLKDLGRVGLASRSAVGGDSRSGHVFVDNTGWLWTISPDLQVSRLGYQEFFKPMLESEIVVSYNEAEKTFYICNDDFGFALNKNGLSQIGQKVTSCFVESSECKAVAEEQNTKAFYLETDHFDFGMTGMKLISFVEIPFTGIKNLHLRLFANYGGDQYIDTGWKRAREGICYMGVSGQRFRLCILGDLSEASKIEYLNIKWKKADNRFHRGLTAGQEQ